MKKETFQWMLLIIICSLLVTSLLAWVLDKSQIEQNSANYSPNYNSLTKHDSISPHLISDTIENCLKKFNNLPEIIDGKCKVNGTIASYMDGTAISGAEITIWRHRVFVQDNKVHIGDIDTSFYMTTCSNSVGYFEFSLPTTTNIDYLGLTFNHPNWNKKHQIALYVDDEITQNLDTVWMFSPKWYLTGSARDSLETRMHAKLKYRSQNKTQSRKWHSGSDIKNHQNITFCEGNFCQTFGLHSGYNGKYARRGFAKNIVLNNEREVIMSSDWFIAGVIQGEIKFFTNNLQALATQAIVARTYARRNKLQNLPENFGHAFGFMIDDLCLKASRLTHGQIIVGKDSSGHHYLEPILAYYSARCNGDFTQSAHQGVWSPYSSAKTSGSTLSYLPKVPCSGHENCYNFQHTEKPCNHIGSNRYIFGHGVGLCQRGAIDFARRGWTAGQIVHHYYRNVEIIQVN